MKFIDKYFIVFSLMLFAVKFSMGQPQIIPSLREWTSDRGYYRLTNGSNIVYRQEDYEYLKSDMEQFRNDLLFVSGKNIPISTKSASRGDICFELGLNNDTIGEEGYEMKITSFISVRANTTKGIFYGMQTLLQIFHQKNIVAQGYTLDYPKVDERGFMIDCGRKFFEVEYIEALIRKLAWLKMNFLHLHFTDWNGFRLKSELFPGLASEEAYSKEDIKRIQNYAAKYHVLIVPEIDMPAHASFITTYNPYLGFRCQSMRESKWQGEKANQEGKAWTLDVTRTEVKSWIRALLDEWIPLFDSPYFHIGGDEWQYDSEKNECMEFVKAAIGKGYRYPGDLFVEWINEINNQVKSYGKTTQIWNWWNFSPDEKQQNHTSIHPDKDIVINVWNYIRQNEILDEGYQVIISTETGPDALYITPGIGNENPGEYGVFDSKKIYENWKPRKHPNIKGYKVCLWTDNAENRSDEWFNNYYELPLAVFSEKTWGGPRSASLNIFEKKLDMIGNSISQR